MIKKRKEIFDKKKVSPLGKVSLYLSVKNIIHGLVSGSWLDILSGYNADLQQSQLHSPKITKFVSIDHKLNKGLAKKGFLLKEQLLKKTLPVKDKEFENVTMVNGLEHLWFPQEILNECFRSLKKDGVIQVIVPTWFGKPFLEIMAFKMNGVQEAIEMDDHKTYYDEKTLWPMLVRAGFRPRDIEMKRIKLFCSLYIRAIKKI